ncbi:MAG: single-stranded DNA-binding protein [Deltaproteobacteria bacterium]|nr:single-stranded DNA-binding protein [Deltaproteobacteria bacterium]
MFGFTMAIAAGNLTSNPKAGTAQNGSPYSLFTVACNKFFGGQKTTTFIRVKIFGPLAEQVNRNCKQGQLVLVYGEIDSNEYTDRTGQRRNDWSIRASKVIWLGRGADTQTSQQIPQVNRPVQQAAHPQANQQTTDVFPFNSQQPRGYQTPGPVVQGTYAPPTQTIQQNPASAVPPGRQVPQAASSSVQTPPPPAVPGPQITQGPPPPPSMQPISPAAIEAEAERIAETYMTERDVGYLPPGEGRDAF